eukprot:GHVN01022111.1.p1 GENE.GHVN01022111.1~~GHVN01022111.1.p1  ORF type:complete len:148 (+),score=19.24 GHVN01022111.1:172-615(+)
MVSLTCTWLYREVEMVVRRRVLALPCCDAGIETNLSYWLKVIRFFFSDSAKTLPLNRLTYRPIVSALRDIHRVFDVQPHSQMVAKCVVTLDRLPPESIQYCARWHPQPHTSHISRQITPAPNMKKAVTSFITLPHFLAEYRSRIQPT